MITPINDKNLAIFTAMNEEKKVPEISAESAAAEKAEKARMDRVKRMRGWLGIKSSVETHNLGGGGDVLIDVDAPNGWNR